ncbi:hypothetical protein K1719_001653 [Acacia pycnantha]|nr:hypothetical protein K1719_001653 [Acacia pycnantha]
MRIRKHTKLCGGESSLQFDGDEDSFSGNGSRGDSVGATESVASIMDAENQTKPFPKVEDMVVVHENEAKVLDDIDEGSVVDETISFCQKIEAKYGHWQTAESHASSP